MTKALLVWMLGSALATAAAAQVLPGLGSADPSQQLKTLAPPIGADGLMGAPWFGAQPPLVTMSPEVEQELMRQRVIEERRTTVRRKVRRRNRR